MKKTGKIWVALITALSLAMPMNVWADTKITSISLKIDSSIEAGDSDCDVDVTTSSRYCSVDDVEVTNEPSDEWKSGARPKIKVKYSQMVMRTLAQVLQKVIFLSVEMMLPLHQSVVPASMN